MDKSMKKMLILITYTVILYWALTNIQYIAKGTSTVLNILSPIFIGGVLAFILNRLLSFIEEAFNKLFSTSSFMYKKKRTLATILTYVIAILLVASIVFFIVPQIVKSVQNLVEKFPQYAETFYEFMNDIFVQFGLSNEDLNSIFGNWKEMIGTVGEFAANTMDKLFGATVNLATTIANIFIGIIFSVYILIYKEKLIAIGKKIIVTFATTKMSQRIFYVLKEINHTFTRFVGGQLTEAFILGGMCFLGMKILSLPYAPLIGVLIGITSLIPVFGALIGTIPSAFIIFMENPMQALIFILFLIIIQQIEGNFIYPKVVGNAIGLDGFWVFLAIIIGGNAFGIIGMLLGVPSMAVIYTLIREFTNKAYAQKKKS